MPNTININGQITLAAGGLKTVLNLTDSFTTTGSNFITNNATITTASWAALDQGSNTNYRIGYFVNADATSSCFVAINSTGSYAALLAPGDVAILPNNSGSAVTLWAKATGSNASIILQYLALEA